MKTKIKILFKKWVKGKCRHICKRCEYSHICDWYYILILGEDKDDVY